MFRAHPDTGLHAILHRPRPSPRRKFLQSPVVFVAGWLYDRHCRRLDATTDVPTRVNPLTVVCVSDTHDSRPDLPPGDILVHAGDLTRSGTRAEIQAQLDWLRAQPHARKIVVAGNHDMLLDQTRDSGPGRQARERESLDWGDVTYLEDSAVDLQFTGRSGEGRRLRVYGSPRSPKYGNWAFQCPRSDGDRAWAGRVPRGTDILVTHGPPAAHGDLLGLGCPALLGVVWRVRPALCVFGHVHEGYGVETVSFDAVQKRFEGIVVAAAAAASSSRGGFDGYHSSIWLWWMLIGLCWETVKAWAEMSGRESAGRETGMASATVASAAAATTAAAASRTLLVNAAVVGGLRDDERRKPIVVVI